MTNLEGFKGSRTWLNTRKSFQEWITIQQPVQIDNDGLFAFHASVFESDELGMSFLACDFHDGRQRSIDAYASETGSVLHLSKRVQMCRCY